MLGNHGTFRVLARPEKSGFSNTMNCLRSFLPGPLGMRLPSQLSHLSVWQSFHTSLQKGCHATCQEACASVLGKVAFLALCLLGLC